MIKGNLLTLCISLTVCNAIFGMEGQSAKTQDPWDSQAYDSCSDFKLGIAQNAWEDFFNTNPNFVKYINGFIASIECGSGRFELQLAKTYPICNFYGIDSSLSQIEQVARHIFACNVNNIEFHRANAAQFKIDSIAKFNFIFSSMMLHSVKSEHRQDIITHISNQLDPDGAMLIIGLRVSNTITPLGQAFNYAMNLPEYEESLTPNTNTQRYMYYIHKDNIERMCQNAGLKVVYTCEYLHEHTFASADEFGKFIRSWVYALPVVTSLPEQKRDSFVQCVINKYVENIQAQNGLVTYATPLLAIGAVKG